MKLLNRLKLLSRSNWNKPSRFKFLFLVFSLLCAGIAPAQPTVLLSIDTVNVNIYDTEKTSLESNKKKYIGAFRKYLTKYLTEKEIKLAKDSISYRYFVRASIAFTRGSKEEKISDSQSPDYGSIYKLKRFDVDVDLVFTDLADHSNSKDWSLNESDEETITNRQSFFEALFGQNKDATSYRVKTKSESVYFDLVRKVARRSSNKVKKMINRITKKETYKAE